MSRRPLGGVLAVLVLTAAAPARAIPAFARKYQTSCLTCHTVYPKLNPFGEAFRRDGYRFPGVDSDYIKAEQVALGQEANKKTFPKTVWPDWIPAAIPISVGANGQALVIPSKTSSAGQAANGTHFSLQDLQAEAHIWGGAAFDDTITAWFEVTFSSRRGRRRARPAPVQRHRRTEAPLQRHRRPRLPQRHPVRAPLLVPGRSRW